MKVTFLTESNLAELIRKKESSQKFKKALRELKESVARDEAKRKEEDAERFGKTDDMKVDEDLNLIYI